MDEEMVKRVLDKMEREGTIKSRIDPATGQKAYRLTNKGLLQKNLLLSQN